MVTRPNGQMGRRGEKCAPHERMSTVGRLLMFKAMGIWAAIRNVFPEAMEQRCWKHRILNVLDRIPKKYQLQVKPLLTAIPYAETLKQCETLKAKFPQWCARKNLPEAALVPDEDW